MYSWVNGWLIRTKFAVHCFTFTFSVVQHINYRFRAFLCNFPLLFVHIQIPIKSMKWKLRFHEILITHSFMCINEIKYKLKRIKNYVKCEWHSLGFIMIMELNISKFKRVLQLIRIITSKSLLHDFFKKQILRLKVI